MQVMSNGKVRRTEAEWREILARGEQSGHAPREFCRSEGIQVPSYLRWQRKLAGSKPTGHFVPVTSTPSRSTPWTLLITLPNGCELRLQG
jgi:hypothetical protein